MEVFKVRPGGINEIKRKVLLRTLPVLIIMVISVPLILHQSEGGKSNLLSVYLYIIPLLIAVTVFGFLRGLKTQGKIFESYELTIANECITREQNNTPTISIPFNEINEIIKNTNGSFTIKGNDLFNTIGVPSQIENYESLEKLLGGIKPITIKESNPLLSKYGTIIVPLVTFGLFAGFWLSNNKIILSICGISLLATLGYSFYMVQTNKNISYQTKRRSWLSVWVGICIAVGLYMKLTGHLGGTGQGYNDSGYDNTDNDTTIHKVVQQKPKFLDGDLYEYLGNKIEYPEKEREKGITGTVYINFVVEKDGSITNVTVFKGIPNGSALDSEAVEVISSMPNWKPGMQNGHPVRVSYNIPIHFDLH